MGQIQLTVALVLIGLFSIAVIGFATNFASDNNAAVDISNDPEISSLYTQQSGNISAFETASESQQQSILSTTIEPGSDVAQSTGPFAVTQKSSIQTLKNIMEVGYVKIFGTNTGFRVFLTALVGIVIFMLGLFLYKTLRGAPD